MPSTINSVIDLQSSLDVPKHEHEQNKRFMARATFHYTRNRKLFHIFFYIFAIYGFPKTLLFHR